MKTVAEKVDNTRLGAIRERFDGVLPDDWSLTTLGEVFKWRSGGTPLRTNERFYGGDIPWLIIGDLNDGLVTEAATTITEEGLENSATRWVEPGSVMLAMYGSIGKLGIAGRRLTTNQAIAFTLPEPNDAKYLFYYLMYSREALASLGKGATQKNISQAVIKEFPFPLAPLPEQRRIVGAIERHLGRLDAAVARLHAAKAKLKRYKQAVLKAAVEGRLTAVWREEHPNAFPADVGLSKHIAERRTKWEREKLKEFGKQPRNDAWKLKYKEPPVIATDNLPELPEGWTWVGLEQVAQGGQHALKAGPFGSALKKEFYVAKGYKIYGQEQVISGDPLYGDYYIDAARYESLKACAVKPGDLLISLVGTVGCVLILPDDIEPGIINPRLVKISVDANVMLPEYLKAYLESPYARQLFSLSTHGGTMEILNLSILKALPIPLPPIQEQRELLRIMDEASSSDGELDSTLDAQLLQATRLRQAVLKRAFEGRLK